MSGRESKLYGRGWGKKAENLVDLTRETGLGVEVLPFVGIGESYFRDFVLINDFSCEHWPTEVAEGRLPDNLVRANREILEAMPIGRPLVIRSSAVGEKGGTGIFSSYFMVRGNDLELDLVRMGELEKLIYADYFSDNVRDYLGEGFLKDGGMGLMVQEVVGDAYEGGYFMPLISGVATVINGEMVLRLVLGLGTKAVSVDEAVVVREANFDLAIIRRALLSLVKVEAIDLAGRVVKEKLSWEVGNKMVERGLAKLGALIGALKEQIMKGRRVYWEFAIEEGTKRPLILQANEEAANTLVDGELPPVTGRVLGESNDVVNQGRKTGRGIFYLGAKGYAGADDLVALAAFNRENRGYLLIVADRYLTWQGGLEFRYFSRAAGVVEVQFPDLSPLLGGDHRGLGGSHFLELCKERGILFQGVFVPLWDESMGQALGPMTERWGALSGYWDLEYLMTNVGGRGRTEVFGEVVVKPYPRGAVAGWEAELGGLAYSMEVEDPLFESFNHVANHLRRALGNSMLDYDPFGVVGLSQVEKMDLWASLEVVLANLFLTDSYAAYREGLKYGLGEAEGNVFGLKKYLEELLGLVS